jgi:Ni,Fe-hydrogenase maturation factor
MNSHAAVSQPDTVSEPHQEPSYLVINYGRLTQGRDAVSDQITTQVQAWEFPNVEVCTVEHLTPELSTRLAEADYVIFVDACQVEDTEVKVTPLEACGLETAGSSVPGWGHSWHPCSLLALTHSLYCRHPQAWWVEIATQDLDTKSSRSPQTKQRVEHAVSQIKALID